MLMLAYNRKKPTVNGLCGSKTQRVNKANSDGRKHRKSTKNCLIKYL
jgi:hypothetical protein